MRINHRRFHIFMSQQLLNRANVSTILQQMRRKRDHYRTGSHTSVAADAHSHHRAHQIPPRDSTQLAIAAMHSPVYAFSVSYFNLRRRIVLRSSVINRDSCAAAGPSSNRRFTLGAAACNAAHGLLSRLVGKFRLNITQ